MVVQGTVDSPIATVCGWPNVQAMTLSETHNPRRTRLAVVGFAALTVLFLAGCSNAVEHGTSASSREAIPAEATPMFASDKEAAAAAERAYRNYIDVSDQIARDGGANSERLEPFVSGELYAQQTHEYDDVESKGLRATGASTFDSFKLESYDNRAEIIRAYVCIRVSNIRVLDTEGNDVTPVERSDALPLQLEFVQTLNSQQELLIFKSEVWPGLNFC
jgi:hypothetical protein